ncbi:MAG: nicotinate-nucleotide diphosphorylase (carboxylating), partial [Kutzneria sp.]|nr:nicotinate-nucleotide diphosphorylase (carboxylating) [Kutzneria sp.]
MNPGTAGSGIDTNDMARVIRAALEEDLRYGFDVTTAATVPADAIAVASFTPRREGTIAGIPVVLAVLDEVVGNSYRVVSAADDGTRLSAGEPALVVSGPVRGLVTAERTALNLLCHLSGVATATAAWVEAVAGTGCVIRDSRKTLPGLRLLQKYAVRCGGGANHRLGLG